MNIDPSVTSPWPHRLAVVTAGATLLLIFVGGLVTNTGSALAVPDWPTTFGYNMFTFPWSRMVGGVFFEHVHRLIGSAVGMLTVSFAVTVWLTDGRRWMRRLALVAVIAVIMQGVLGGLRVVLLEHGLAIIHGCVAQAFLALMVSLAVCTSSWWHCTLPPRQLGPSSARLRSLAIVTAALVYLQIVFGALLTHNGSRLVAHLLNAGLVTVWIGILAGQILYRYPDDPKLLRPAKLLVILLSLQLSLGLGAYIWRFTEIGAGLSTGLGLAFEVCHRLNGAALWGTAVMLTLRILRVVGFPPRVVLATSVAGKVTTGRVLA